MDNVTLKNLTLFEEFCGSQWFERVVMMTTMWDRLKDKTMGERREEELRSTFWRPMIDCGSTIVRYESNRESAWHILRLFLDTPRHPLQERAGSILANKLKETYQQLRKQIAGVPRKFLSNVSSKTRSLQHTLNLATFRSNVGSLVENFETSFVAGLEIRDLTLRFHTLSSKTMMIAIVASLSKLVGCNSFGVIILALRW